MRKLLSILALSVFISCNTADDKTTSADSTNSSSEAVTYASTVTYSSEFEMGNNKQAQTIVSLWKDFDDNNLKNSMDIFADSMTMEFPGMTLAGTRDSVISSTQTYRDGYTKLNSVVEAVLPTRAKNRNEDWVAIWGMETKTDKAGKTDSVRIHEIWRFNKDGKIDYMAQFVQPQQ
jgi:hypothetical protein